MEKLINQAWKGFWKLGIDIYFKQVDDAMKFYTPEDYYLWMNFCNTTLL